jgi:hypothetical protein
MTLTREEIRFGYMYILGREPESEHIYTSYSKVKNVLQFRQALLRSEEGQEKIRRIQKEPSYTWGDFSREVFCFIHLEKTGGTTFHSVLSRYFREDRVSPPHLADLHHLSLSKLNQYDFISGHFDHVTSLFLPSFKVKRIAIFRRPLERLISFYRFHRCHPAERANTNEFVALAQRLAPEDFFSHPSVVRSPRLNNTYLRAFGTSFYESIPEKESEREIADALDVASTRILSLDALGLTENMNQSVEAILTQLGFEPAGDFESFHLTDGFADKLSGFSQVPQVAMTKAVCDAIQPLVSADMKLYELAAAEFSKRAICQSDISSAMS